MMRNALDNVARDLGPLRARVGVLSILAVTDSSGDRSWLDGLPDGSTRWVLTVGGSQTAIDATTEPQAAVDIASYVQDVVIDELGAPWPEIPGVGVLDAAVIDGVAWWTHAAHPYARVGELTPAGL
jgi:hypothetical protein